MTQPVDLAPATDATDLRCAPWTRAQGVDPIGSAGQLDHLLLVEWPLPWPSDVADIAELSSAATDPRARIMTVVPQADLAASDGLLRVVDHRRVATHHLAGVDHRVPQAEVPALLARLLDDLDSPHLDWPSAVGDAPPEVLVCGHGRRDACCGRWGTLLHAEMAARHPDLRVWRCSHTGGHRFAPTAITLPDGRAWAYVDADLLDGVLQRTADPAGSRPTDRGSLTFDPWTQVLEREVFGRIGWSWLDHQVTAAEATVEDAGRTAQVQLTWRTPDGAAGGADGVVEITRLVPVLVCGEPPEAAKKTSPDFALRSFELTPP